MVQHDPAGLSPDAQRRIVERAAAVERGNDPSGASLAIPLIDLPKAPASRGDMTTAVTHLVFGDRYVPAERLDVHAVFGVSVEHDGLAGVDRAAHTLVVVAQRAVDLEADRVLHVIERDVAGGVVAVHDQPDVIGAPAHHPLQQREPALDVPERREVHVGDDERQVGLLERLVFLHGAAVHLVPDGHQLVAGAGQLDFPQRVLVRPGIDASRFVASGSNPPDPDRRRRT